MPARSWWGVLAGMIAGLVAASAWAQSQELFRVSGVAKGDVLNMRSSPSTDASTTGTIPADASGIVRVGDCRSWCQVRYGRLVGWVNRRYLQAVPAQTAVAPTVVSSSDPIDDCNSDDTPRILAGCSALISRGALPPTTLAVAYSRRSDAHLDSAKLDAAIADRAKASELSPDDTAYQQRLSHLHLLRAASWPLPGKLNAALKDYSDAIRLDPTSHEAYAGRSSLYVLKDDYDSGITDLRAALSHHKGEETVYELALARLCERRGIQHLLEKEFDKAIARFTEAIGLNASRDALYVHRASAHALKDDVEPALKDYSEAIRVNPHNIEAYIGRGELYRRRTALREALNDFDEAVTRQPSNLTVLMFRALTREDMRHSDAAIADYQAVVKLDTKHKLARASIERLRVKTASSDTVRETSSGGALPSKPSAEEARIRRKQYQCCLTYSQNVTNPQDVPYTCRIGVEQGTNFCSLIGVRAQAAKKIRGYSQNCCTTLPNGSVHCAFFPGCRRRPGDPTP